MGSYFQLETEELVYGGRYAGREDFAAVVQPFFRNSMLPLNAVGLLRTPNMCTLPLVQNHDILLFLLQDGRPDTTYFSVDCFHFSERGHAEMASALWNNMVSAAGRPVNGQLFDRGRISPWVDYKEISPRAKTCKGPHFLFA